MKRKEESQTKAADRKREVDSEFDQDHTRLMYKNIANSVQYLVLNCLKYQQFHASSQTMLHLRHGLCIIAFMKCLKGQQLTRIARRLLPLNVFVFVVNVFCSPWSNVSLGGFCIKTERLFQN